MKIYQIYSVIAALLCASAAQAAWVSPSKNLACSADINEWGKSSSCACSEGTAYNEKIGECMFGEPYPIMVSGVLRSKDPLLNGVSIATRYGSFKLIVKQAELEKLQNADRLYFEVEGEFVLLQKEPSIIVDRLSWLD